MTTLDPITGTLGTKRAAHLLRRLTFGPAQTQIDTFATYTIDQAIAALFDGFVMPSAPTKPDASVWVNVAPLSNEKDFELFSYFKYWWLGQMAISSTSLEKLVFFIHTIITTKQDTGGSARDIYFQNALFRQYLINDFTDTVPLFNRYKSLIKKICIDNSMLSFLNGNVNVKGRPNENFARELLELFTIGKGPTIGVGNYTNYTENDIKAAAKALTGWDKDYTFATLDTDTSLPRGKIKGSSSNASSHDNTTKTLSSAFSNTAITPNATTPTEASALDEISQLIDAIYNQDEASRFLVRKLYRFFVHYNIDATIETDIIIPLATLFKSGGFRLRTVLEKLCKSEHFFEAASGINDDKMGGTIKSPLDLVLGTLRYFEVSFPASGTTDFNSKMGQIENYINTMGLSFLDPYDVAGYEAYYQVPLYSRNWINTNTLLRRYIFIKDIFTENTNGLAYIDPLVWFNKTSIGVTDTIATTDTLVGTQKLAKMLIEHIAQKLLVYSAPTTEISDERYNYFAVYHLGGLSFENWVFNWTNRNGSNMMIKDDATARLRNILFVLMQSPEYQLM